MSDQSPEVKELPQARINFIYLHATDMEAMRSFYKDLLGCSEIHYRALDREGYGWSVFDMGSFQFMIHPDTRAVPHSGWSMQPGWDGGTVPGLSWSIIVTEAAFRDVVSKVLAAGMEVFHKLPQWCQDSYWSFPVRDPMGNTVEVHSIPVEKPASTEWA